MGHSILSWSFQVSNSFSRMTWIINISGIWIRRLNSVIQCGAMLGSTELCCYPSATHHVLSPSQWSGLMKLWSTSQPEEKKASGGRRSTCAAANPGPSGHNPPSTTLPLRQTPHQHTVHCFALYCTSVSHSSTVLGKELNFNITLPNPPTQTASALNIKDQNSNVSKNLDWSHAVVENQYKW